MTLMKVQLSLTLEGSSVNLFLEFRDRLLCQSSASKASLYNRFDYVCSALIHLIGIYSRKSSMHFDHILW